MDETNGKIFYVDALDDISDDIHSIGELIYTIGENLDESTSGRDLYGELAFLGRSLEKVREEMRRIMSELQECDKIVG